MKRSLWVDKGQEERRKEGEGVLDAGPIVGGWSPFRKMVIAGIRSTGFCFFFNIFFKKPQSLHYYFHITPWGFSVWDPELLRSFPLSPFRIIQDYFYI